MSINVGLLSRSARFGTVQLPLRDVTQWALNGRLRLPVFQRPWLWGCGETAALLESLILGHDVGGLVLLESEGFSVGFDSALMEGAKDAGPFDSIAYLLDGRQRLTAMTHVLQMQTPSPLSGLEKDFYLDPDMAAKGEEGCLTTTPKNGFIPLKGCFSTPSTSPVLRRLQERELSCMRVRLTRDYP